jgi:hypothetical protein
VFDVVVIGAGAAGLTAAVVAASEGLKTLLLEAEDVIGGTTAWSGGMVWCPGNGKIQQSGDGPQAAINYLHCLIPEDDPRRQVRDSLLRHGPEAIAYLETHTRLSLQPVATYPDYYPGYPGATLGGRVLEPRALDGRRLGKDFALLRPPLPEFTLFGGMMLNRADLPHFRRIGRSVPATARAARLLLRYARERLSAPRGTTLHHGNALAGWLLWSARELGVTTCMRSRVTALARDPAYAFKIIIRSGAEEKTVRVRRAAILATGGFAHDASLKRALQPAAAQLYSACAPGAVGAGLQFGLDNGATLGEANLSASLWVPVSRFTRADGTRALYPHTVTDRAKPGLIAVGPDARRFTNEALSYHEFGLAMLSHGLSDERPAFLICDRRFLWRYGLGRIKPFCPVPGRYVRDGYLNAARSLEVLAAQIGLEPAALRETVSSYNHHARVGEDPAFGRGGDAYQRHMGDATHQPNPCIAPITRPPFYALAVYPGTLGTAAGLRTDGYARVLDKAGQPIPALYACGNDMNSPFSGAYPGPGITLGPALTFGYLAARHASASREKDNIKEIQG